MPSFETFIQERIYLRNVSPRMVEWYRQTFKWLEKYPLTEEGLKELVISMQQAGLQAISCNNRIRCINAYLSGLLAIARFTHSSRIASGFTCPWIDAVLCISPLWAYPFYIRPSIQPTPCT
ncbi:MAG TPA: hypothetical protein VGR76_05295 [Candidatus Angelobacter sp.]|nr:hypothetical protein [Candidatus Angelobacter sp.]